MYKKSIENIPSTDLVFIDETGVERKLVQEYFWTQKGKLKHIKVPGKRSVRTNIIAALTNKGIKAQFTFEGSCNSEIFKTYIKDVLCPVLRPGQVIIIDNASFHKSEKIRELVEEVKCKLIYLSPYSPELNPIEHYWSVLKSRIKFVRKTVECFSTAVEQSILSTQSFGLSYCS